VPAVMVKVLETISGQTVYDIPDVRPMNIKASWHNLMCLEQEMRSSAVLTNKIYGLICDNMVILKWSLLLDKNLGSSRNNVPCEHVVRYLCSVYRTVTKVNMVSSPTMTSAYDLRMSLLESVIGAVYTLLKMTDKTVTANSLVSIKAFVDTTDDSFLITTWLEMMMTMAGSMTDKIGHEVYWCHNETCRNLEGPSELQLKTFSDGHGKRFCSRNCQADDWKRSNE